MSSILSRLSLVNRAAVLIEPFFSAISVKDYGAKGDGATNDGAAIQAALNAAYGSSSPHAQVTPGLNKIVYFPAGTYLVDQQLFLNYAFGACLIGAGSQATRLLYTGPDSKLSTLGITSLMTAWSMQYSHIQGITFDATGSNATACFALQSYAPSFTGKIDDGGGTIASNFQAGAAGGAANAITVTDAGFTATDGQAITFIPSTPNTGATTLNPSSFGAVPVLKNIGAGPVALTGGELGAGSYCAVVYRTSDASFHIANTLTVSGLTGKIFTSPIAKFINPVSGEFMTNATFTGTITGGTSLAVSGVAGSIRAGDALSFSGAANSPVIVSGSGPYVISPAQSSVGPIAMKTTFSNWALSQLTSTTYLAANPNDGSPLIAPSQTMAAQVPNDGTGNLYLDCGFVGSAGDGFLCYGGSGQLGSEEQFRNCIFDSCAGFGGLRIVSGNALDYSIIGCVFQNCATGISVVSGTVNLIQGCRFHNNSVLDININNASGCPIIGCQSDSPNFCASSPGWIAGCYHTGAGQFWNATALGSSTIVIDGCVAPSSNALSQMLPGYLYMMGNNVSAPSFFNSSASAWPLRLAAFTAKIDDGAGGPGNILTVSLVSSGAITSGPANTTVYVIPANGGSAIRPGTAIVSGSGSVWTVSGAPQLVASQAMACGYVVEVI